MVGMEGVEPTRLTAPGSKPGVSTSSTTSPNTDALYRLLLLNGKIKYRIINYSSNHFFSSFEGSKVQLHIRPP